MNKTPIMILQELGVKECVIPQYTIIYSQSGTHENIFTFKVKYNNLCAEGTASNKKEAKQNAAQNMLKLLQETNSISSRGLKLLELIHDHGTTEKCSLSSSTTTPLNNINYIGILQEYCLQNNLIKPEYEICEIEGPAHRASFKMLCKLGSISEEAVANTKKQAKQLVSQKILQYLRNVNVTNIGQCQVNPTSSSQTKTDEATFKDLGICMENLKIVNATDVKDVKSKYLKAINKENILALSNIDNKVPMSDYHLYFKSMILRSVCSNKGRELDVLYNTLKTYVEEHTTLEKSYRNDTSVNRQILRYIKEKLNLSIKKVTLLSKTKKTIIGFRINLIIPFVQFGMSDDPMYAEQEALTKTIEAIIHYLK